jgi:hypothetical protein
MTRPNSSGVVRRPVVVTGIVSCVPAGDGWRPMRPPGFVAFCSCTAAATSSTVIPSCAMRSGSRLMSIEKSSVLKNVVLPTPGRRLISFSMYSRP